MRGRDGEGARSWRRIVAPENGWGISGSAIEEVYASATYLGVRVYSLVDYQHLAQPANIRPSPLQADLCDSIRHPLTPSFSVEYRNKSMAKIFGGPYNGTYVLAVIIFSLGIIRDLM